MGAKRMSKLIAVFVALAVMMTSGISVFAAGSPTKGGTTNATVTTIKKITVNAKSGTIKYRLKGGKWKTAKVSNGTAVFKAKKHKKYQIKADGKTFYRVTCQTKIKSAKAKGKTVTVKFKKKDCANKYTITAVRASDGKVVTKTVKKTTGKIKLAKGTWKITVTVKNGKYVGKASAAKTVTVK